MSKTIEMWILDNAEEEVPCPSCEVNVQLEVLNKAYEMNKKFKWSRKLSIKCPYCKKIIAFEVSWIPEWVRARAMEV